MNRLSSLLLFLFAAAIVAATSCISSGNASLATGNTGDFGVFVDSGLKLVEASGEN